MDVTVPSAVLGRDTRVRLVLPMTASSPASLSVVYLLHGAGVTARDWTNNSDIAALAEHNIVLVMPFAEDAFYINEARGSNREYENYFIHELMPAVHSYLPKTATDRKHTAIAGISRGGFGAVVLGLHHPELFSFIGDLSGALDLPQRRFRYTAPLQSLRLERAFGPDGSDIRRDNDPFSLVATWRASATPYFFISCGSKDSLLPVNQRFAALLNAHSVRHEFRIVAGGHDWRSWNEALPSFEAALLTHRNESFTVGPS